MSSGAHIVVFDRNAAVRKRIGRVLGAAGNLEEVAGYDLVVPEAFAGRPRLIGCNLEQLSAVTEVLADDLPFTQLLVWGTRDSRTFLSRSSSDRRYGRFVAWPEFASMPRPAELFLTASVLLSPSSGVALDGLVLAGAATRTFEPRTTDDLEETVQAVRDLSLQSGIVGRQAERIAVAAHELLMNAMYGAPTTSDGLPKYAHDRKQTIRLERQEIPTVKVATDGSRFGIEVSDPFGRLSREHLFSGVARGLASRDAGDVLDTSHGGAGIGLFKIFDAAHSVFIDVRHLRSTRVTAVFDLDVTARDQRAMPTTLCWFED
ncbi:MAG: hypothetical protein RMA76_28975 [Deltaproteobacteria bacterium]|jgi:hypothetical protein